MESQDERKASAVPEPPTSTKVATTGKDVNSVMEQQVQKLAEKIWSKFQALDASQRYLLAIAGIPGSGKTTFASSLIHRLNCLHQISWHKLHPHAADYSLGRSRSYSNNANHHRHTSDSTNPDVAYLLPLDGYHLTREQLSALPNPKEAHYRRGAPFTFDPKSYTKLLTQLRQPLEATSRTLYAPSFDHAVKDPVENDIPLPPCARIVVIEGLYVALDYPPWSEAISLYDEIWLLNVSIETATERVARRNFAAGLSPSYEEALKRTINNDMRNAQEIIANLPSEDRIIERIQSYNDDEWKSEEQKRMEEEEEEEERSKRLEQEREMGERFRAERMGSIAEMAEAGAGM